MTGDGLLLALRFRLAAIRFQVSCLCPSVDLHDTQQFSCRGGPLHQKQIVTPCYTYHWFPSSEIEAEFTEFAEFLSSKIHAALLTALTAPYPSVSSPRPSQRENPSGFYESGPDASPCPSTLRIQQLSQATFS